MSSTKRLEVIEAIKKRYSCRSYSDKRVPKETVLELLELANQAPSASNHQNRQFIVVTKADDRKWLKDMNNQPYLGEAPVVIIVTTKLEAQTAEEYLKGLEDWDMTVAGTKPADLEISDDFQRELKEMKYKWMISDAATAVENLLLAATDRGLATCWIGIMDLRGIMKRFDIPRDHVPVCLVTLGYPKSPPKSRAKRKDIKDLVHWGRFSA